MSVIEGLPFKEDKKTYILQVLDPVLEEMVSDVLTEMPKSPMDFMIVWLRKRSGAAPSSVQSLTEKNKALKRELTQCNSALDDCSGMIQATEEKEEEEEDDDDECDEIPESFKKSEESMGRARQSVSAEAYGTWNTKKAFTPPSYPKTDEQKSRLNGTLMKSFMFSELEKKDMETVLMACKEVPLEAGVQIIKEGDDGDFLFVIESGTLECKKVINNEEKVVKTCNAGDVFGELAILYNCPRAASVVAKDKCICWQLDRETVNAIVKDAAVRRRNKYDAFLQQVTLIASIGAYERSQIADALKPETFQKDAEIVKQDDPGDKFYIVEEGELYAKKIVPGEGDKRVMEYKAGDYFGELALLKNQPRAASVIVASDSARVLSMTRASFSKMLGPLQSVLAKQVAAYK
jgi:cAMP-dependent protein kinase regulator